MPLSSKPGAIKEVRHASSSSSSSKDERHLQEPRILACVACRKKKRRCNRVKPSCGACLNAHRECIYGGRKPRITAEDLNDKLRRLEHKYAICLKAAKFVSRTGKSSVKFVRSKRSPQCDDNAGRSSDQISTKSTSSVGSRYLSIFTPRPPDTYHPYGGYHFDDNFLTMPPTKGVASEHREPSLTSYLSEDTPRFTHSTRIFTPIPQIPPTVSTTISTLPCDSPVTLGSSPSVDGWPGCRAAKRQRLTPPPVGDGLHQWQPEANDVLIRQCTQDLSARSNNTELGRYTPPKIDITEAPGLHFSRATWWDCLLSTYTTRPDASYTTISRNLATAEITRDVRVFFKAAPFWLAFLNVPLFFDSFYHPERRGAIQPALVLSILAYAKLLQSNHDARRGQSPQGRDRAWRQSVVLRDLAQASFEASYNAGWIDVCLAQAAFILALYEMSPHTDYAPHRMESAGNLLDNVLHVLGLTTIDVKDPRAPRFAPNAVPSLGRPLPNGARDNILRDRCSIETHSCASSRALSSIGPPSPAASIVYQGVKRGGPFDSSPLPVKQQPIGRDVGYRSGISARCPCHTLSLSDAPEALRNTRAYMPRWAPNGSLVEIRKEEARRLVWTSVILFGFDEIGRRAAGLPQINLHVGKPESFRLLYPGEDDYSSLPNVDAVHSGKESNWALWARVTLLWFVCARHSSVRELDIHPSKIFNSPFSDDDRIITPSDTDFAMRAWMETVAIEAALDTHTCDTEKSMMYQARQLIFVYVNNIRMQISGGFRHSIPVVQTGVDFSPLDRESAMTWVRHVDGMATLFLSAASRPGDNLGRRMLVDRPFIGYVSLAAMLRAIRLYKIDRSLSLASEAAKKLLRFANWYQDVWPCAELQRWMTKASIELESMCGTPENGII